MPDEKEGRTVFSSAQVGEWLKPADCKSAPPRRYEGSNPSLCTRLRRLAGVSGAGVRNRNPESSLRGSLETLSGGAGRVFGFGRFVLDNPERPAHSPGNTGNPGNVRVQDVGTPQRRDRRGRQGKIEK